MIENVVIELPGRERRLDDASPVTVGQDVVLELEARSGDVAVVLVGIDSAWLPLRARAIPLVTGGIVAVIPFEAPGGMGTSTTQVPVASLGPDIGGLTLTTQLVALGGAGGTLTFSHPSSLTMLPEALD